VLPAAELGLATRPTPAATAPTLASDQSTPLLESALVYARRGWLLEPEDVIRRAAANAWAPVVRYRLAL